MTKQEAFDLLIDFCQEKNIFLKGETSETLTLSYDAALNVCEHLAGASSVRVGGMKILRLDKPFPLKDILTRLVKATEYLLNQKDYDGPGYEELGHCVSGAKEVIEVLDESPSSSEENYQAKYADALEWIVLLAGPLRELVEIKKMKDASGKTPEYEQRQPTAWRSAFQCVELLNKDDGFFKKLPYAELAVKIAASIPSSSEAVGDDAIAFAEWIAIRGYSSCISPDSKGNEIVEWGEPDMYRTKQLYELFKQRK